MEQLNGNPSSTFLVDAQTYQDLTEQARLGDLLADKVNGQAEEIAALKSEIKSLQENQGILFGLVAKLKTDRKLQPAQQDRGEILRALLASNGGKMFAKDARNKMHLGKATFSVLLASMKDEIDKKPYHLNRSKLIISLK